MGPPNVGKSTLLQVLSDIQIRTGDFGFTTTRPVGSVAQIEGVDIQLVEIPGLIRGAARGRGGGRALLGVLRSCDAMVLCHDARRPIEEILAVMDELDQADISLPSLVDLTRSDEAGQVDVVQAAVAGVARAAGGLEVIAVSILDDQSLDRLRKGIWRLSGLVRIGLRRGSGPTEGFMSFHPPVTLADVASAIHHDLGRACLGGRIWGPSARFPGQKVGRDHRLGHGDEVEVLT